MKALTVQQKNYMAKRIDAIVEEKVAAITSEYQGKIRVRTGMSTQLDMEAVEGILAGKVKLKTVDDILKTLAGKLERAKERQAEQELARAAGRFYGGCRESISLATFDFVDRKSVAKYNSKGNNQAKKLKSEQDKRCKAVRDEAVKVKDKVILEGSEAAVVLLEKFAKKKF